MKFRNGLLGRTQCQVEPVREELSCQFALPNGVFKLTEVEGPNLRPRICIQEDGGGVSGVETDFADVAYERRASDLEIPGGFRLLENNVDFIDDVSKKIRNSCCLLWFQLVLIVVSSYLQCSGHASAGLRAA